MGAALFSYRSTISSTWSTLNTLSGTKTGGGPNGSSPLAPLRSRGPRAPYVGGLSGRPNPGPVSSLPFSRS